MECRDVKYHRLAAFFHHTTIPFLPHPTHSIIPPAIS